MIFDKSTSLFPMFADSKTSSSLSQREGTEGRECKYSRELTDWLLRSLSVATLNAFPLRSPRGTNKELLYAKS